MFKVECEGCQAPYQVDERRVPPSGLKMRCPKCGTTFVVHPPEGGQLPAPDASVGSKAGPSPARRTLQHTPVPPPMPTAPAPAARNKRTMLGIGLGDIEGAPTGAAPPPLAPPRSPADRRPTGSFSPELDDLDLPEVAGPGIDSPLGLGGDPPLPAAERQSLFGQRTSQLPPPLDFASDLPAPASAAPSDPFGDEFDLSFGDDLPAPFADLPAVGEAADLPALGGELPSIGEPGLPALGGELPAIAPPPLPTAATGLPSVQATSSALPTTADGFGEVDLPLVASRSSLPPEPPSEASEFTAALDDLAAHDFSADHSHAGPMSWEEELGVDEDQSSVTREAGGGTAFGEVDLLGGLDDGPSVQSALSTEGPPEASATSMSGEIQAVFPTAPAIPFGEKAGVEAPFLELPRKVSRRVQVGAVLVSLLLVGGGALEFTSLGAFGRHAVMGMLNKEKYALLLAGSMASARQALSHDTFGDAKEALAALDAAHAESPRAPGLLAYGAFVGYVAELRFGRDSAIHAHAKQQLSDVPFDETGRPIELAHPARAAVEGQLPRARQQVEAVLHRDPSDADALVLAGEIELLAKDHAKAVEAWERAVEGDSGSARSVFGLARAHFAAGDEAAAIEQADRALTLSPRHAGARILKARAIWALKNDEKTALALLDEVVSEGPVQENASPHERVEALTLLGTVHIARSRISDAGKVLVEALKLDPKAGPALAGMGEVLFREGRFTDALARFEAGISADPDGIAAKIGVAKAKIALERLQDAKDMLRKLREARPNDVQVAHWLGRADELLGDKVAAEASYEEAITLGGTRPEVVEPYIALSQLLSADGRPAEAEGKLAEAREKLPGSVAIHKALGDMYLDAGRFQAAQVELEAARRIDPGDLAAVFKLGVVLRQMRKYEDSATMFDAVAAADKEYPGLALERGLLYEASDRTHEALEYYQQALAKAPEDPDLMLRVGSTEVSAGKAEQAVDILRKVLQKRPNSAEANHFLGRALLLRGANLAEALRYLNRAIDIDPNRAEYHLYRGWAANEAGQPAIARDSLLRALALDKQLADAHWQLGVMLRKQGAVVDAVRHLKKALDLRPSRYEAYATLAECYEDRTDWAAAEAAWRKAIQGDPNRPYWRYRLGRMLGARGLTELEVAVKQEEDKAIRDLWLTQAYFELAEAEYLAGKRQAAKDHYIQFLNLSRQDSPYRSDALKKLSSMGVRYDQM